MLLTQAQVIAYKSIEDSGPVKIEPDVTVFVGQNESGKTAFLEAHHKSRSVEEGVAFNYLTDYPRRVMTQYERKHATDPAVVVRATYILTNEEVEAINEDLGEGMIESIEFTVGYSYDNKIKVASVPNPEAPYVQHILKDGRLSSELRGKLSTTRSLAELLVALAAADKNAEETTFEAELKAKFDATAPGWDPLQSYIWRVYLLPAIPRFMYFGDYNILPGKVNLQGLQQRHQAHASTPAALSTEDKSILRLLRLAGIELKDLTGAESYESVKARLEAFSNSISDTVFNYWRQNENLSVEFDIKADPNEEAGFKTGENLYIRIRDQRHRVSVPFNQRSKGFIWFFSFLVWFDSVKEEMKTNEELILLLDEPALSLHALAQEDFLRYIDVLAQEHQVLYTTHSPFMVHPDRLHQVRTVEDREREGTKVTENISGSDPKTLFPLQAALGYTVAQNLFISPRNLLVEGPADLIYLRYFSAALEETGRTFLREDITIVPTGGLDKIATFIALLGANALELAVLHDYEKKPDPRIQSLVEAKLIQEKKVLNYALFRGVTAPAKGSKGAAAAGAASGGAAPTLPNTDVEDLISPDLYMQLFSAAFKKQLGGEVKESDLPPGDRIVGRINRYLEDKGITLRAKGGFNHYTVASHLAQNPLPSSKVDADTLARFAALFEAVNKLYSA